MVEKNDGTLWGFKWIGDDGIVLLAVGCIDNPKWRDKPDMGVTSFTLNHNQRLVGIKSISGPDGYKMAWHYSF